MASGQTEKNGGEIKVVLAQPRGFCAGVERAIDIVERALEKYGAPVYVRHEIVHNKYVVETLRERGAIFVEEVDEIPTGAVTVFFRPRRFEKGRGRRAGARAGRHRRDLPPRYQGA